MVIKVFILFLMIFNSVIASANPSRPKDSIFLINYWGDPGLFSTNGYVFTSNEDRISVARFYARARKVWDDWREDNDDSNVALKKFINECVSTLIPGVHTNGIQLYVAKMRYRMLRRMFERRGIKHALDIEKEFYNKCKDIKLSNIEKKQCKNFILGRDTIGGPRIRIGSVIVVEDCNNNDFSRGIKKEEVFSLLDIACINYANYQIAMPKVLHLLDIWFDNREFAEFDVRIAEKYANVLGKSYDLGAIWILGSLANVYDNDMRYLKFLNIIARNPNVRKMNIVIGGRNGIAREVSMSELIKSIMDSTSIADKDIDVEIWPDL